jgi:AcrR family transcriptional regulator
MSQRVRHSADEARQLILEAAERRFREGGQAAVRVQLVARDVGMTDAAVHHHFGSRKGLLTALLRHAGRTVREQIETAAHGWSAGTRDLASLSQLISECYDERGYARLAMWLMLAGGVSGRGSGMLAELVDILQGDAEHAARVQGLVALSRTETQFVVALFHMIQVAQPLFGEAMLRSAGLPNDDAMRERFQAWLLIVFEELLQPKVTRKKAGFTKSGSSAPGRGRVGRVTR